MTAVHVQGTWGVRRWVRGAIRGDVDVWVGYQSWPACRRGGNRDRADRRRVRVSLRLRRPALQPSPSGEAAGGVDIASSDDHRGHQHNDRHHYRERYESHGRCGGRVGTVSRIGNQPIVVARHARPRKGHHPRRGRCLRLRVPSTATCRNNRSRRTRRGRRHSRGAPRLMPRPIIDLGSTTPWINYEQYSVPVVRAAASDPLVTINVSSGTTPGPVSLHLPADAQPAAGADAHLVVITPDGGFADEFWALNLNADTAGTSIHTDLAGSGVGIGWCRATGVSLLGGLIRPGEMTAIPHVLAIALPGNLLGGGYVWPAISTDAGGPGFVPEGSLLAIPAGTPKPAGIERAGFGDLRRARSLRRLCRRPVRRGCCRPLRGPRRERRTRSTRRAATCPPSCRCCASCSDRRRRRRPGSLPASISQGGGCALTTIAHSE